MEDFERWVTALSRMFGGIAALVAIFATAYGLGAWKRQDRTRQTTAALMELRRTISAIIHEGMRAPGHIVREGETALVEGQRRVMEARFLHRESGDLEERVAFEVQVAVNQYVQTMLIEFAEIELRLQKLIDDVFHESTTLELYGTFTEADVETILAGCNAVNDNVGSMKHGISEATSPPILIEKQLNRTASLREAASGFVMSSVSVKDGSQTVLKAAMTAMDVIYDKLTEQHRSRFRWNLVPQWLWLWRTSRKRERLSDDT